METLPSIQFFIPDFLEKYPWPRQLSDHYLQVEAETKAWTDSWHLFDEEGLDAGRHVKFALFASLAFPHRDKELIGIMSNIFVLFFVIDELTDRGDGKHATHIHDIVMDVLRNPYKARPNGEHKLGEITRETWLRALKYLTPDSLSINRFIDSFEDYTTAVVTEAVDRTERRYRNFENYLLLRRSTSGTLLSFVIVEFGLEITDQIYNHPRVQGLLQQGADLIIFVNDLLSYAKEKMHNDGTIIHNSIELLMVQKQLDIQAAINELGRHADSAVASFIDHRANLPSFGEEADRRLNVFADNVSSFVRANEVWSFETGRYFGNKGKEIQKTRIVTVSPTPLDS